MAKVEFCPPTFDELIATFEAMSDEELDRVERLIQRFNELADSPPEEPAEPPAS